MKEDETIVVLNSCHAKPKVGPVLFLLLLLREREENVEI
jgi:hypothetical protein